jgi:hypothetical protein
MRDLSIRYEDKKDIRDSLLRFYSSEVTTHSALILSTVIAFLARAIIGVDGSTMAVKKIEKEGL